MDLGPLRTVGRPSSIVEGGVVRELTVVDLRRLDEPRGSRPAPLARLSQRHHALARLLAEGTKIQDAAVILGYDPSRISVLKSDPSFQELVRFYSDDVVAKYTDKHEVLGGIMLDAALEIQDRLEDPEKRAKISTRDLTNLIELGADRTGFGPTVRQEVNVNVNVASRLKAARERVAERRKTIDGELAPAMIEINPGEPDGRE